MKANRGWRVRSEAILVSRVGGGKALNLQSELFGGDTGDRTAAQLRAWFSDGT